MILLECLWRYNKYINYPEYNDIEKAKQILSLLHNKDCVVELIEPESDITIKIGDENYIPEAKDCSVISAEYSLGDSAKVLNWT